MGGMPHSKIIPKHRAWVEQSVEMVNIFYSCMLRRMRGLYKQR
jgi:hypothetical protein